MRKIIYLEIDEEITSVIDKLRKVGETEVALVVPKNASLIQSIVNLKLLKRESTHLGKEISLVTTDKIGRNLASQVGITVYQRLDKKTFTDIPTKEESKEEFKEEEKKPEVEIVYRKEKEGKEEKEVIIERKEISSEKPKKDKKKEEKQSLKLLSRKKIIFVFLFIVLLIITLGFLFIPKTQATLFVKAEKLSLDEDFLVKKDETKVNTEESIIPGKLEEITKESSSKFKATGQKDIGEKARGTISVYNKTGIDQIILAGSSFVSSNSLVYTSDSTINVPRATVSLDADGNPIISPGKVSVSITASSAGENYNVSSSHFTIPSLPGKSDKVYGQGGPISGGSSKVVTIVSKEDVDKATQELSDNLYKQAEEELKKKVSSEYKILDEAIKESIAENDGQSKIGTQTSEFELNMKVLVQILVFKTEDLKKLIEEKMKSDIPEGKELMTSGVDSSLASDDEPQFKVVKDEFNKGQITFNIKTNAYLVSKIDQDSLKKEISFENESSIKDKLGKIEGVEKVEIKFWPSFIKISSFLKDRIGIKIEVLK